mmetsp:Transcript_36244/g.67401  ORF Transcript_36244/g.67401 Transcript_36244/m.67401 type:complete len:126 (-) Transcript_36244:71-448(-)
MLAQLLLYFLWSLVPDNRHVALVMHHTRKKSIQPANIKNMENNGFITDGHSEMKPSNSAPRTHEEFKSSNNAILPKSRAKIKNAPSQINVKATGSTYEEACSLASPDVSHLLQHWPMRCQQLCCD